MRAKLVVLILAATGVAGTLLGVRQQRLQAAHELVELHRRIVKADESLWRLRVEIAERVTPERVQRMLAEHPDLREHDPILLEWRLGPDGTLIGVPSQILAGRDRAEEEIAP